MLSVKTNFKNFSEELKAQLFGTKCLLLISIGQEAHEGERFESTIQLINTFFSFCIILLYDSLQRHTMALNANQSPDAFHFVANQEGSAWLKRNQLYLDQLTIPHSVSRWDAWIQHAHYQKYLTQLKVVLTEDTEFGSVFDQTVTQYLERYVKRVEDKGQFNFPRARRICLNYLLEECAVLCLWPELDCRFEIYPNAHNQAMEATREKYITPHYPKLLRSLNLRFRHAKQLKPQTFRLLNEGAVI